ncbi:MAG: protein-L-isoaspartate(D-aspartate) O-methyltransferase [Candidatus Omnitrophota bacterium]
MIGTAKIFYLACFTASLLPRSVFAEENAFVLARQKMVDEQIIARGVNDERTLNAMRKVPRHLFVPALLRGAAYSDQPLPIGRGQTISQPYIVAYMTEKGLVGPEDRVLEIGTGSGYQAAILGELAKEVYSMEIIRTLAEAAARKLAELGYKNVQVKCGDGSQGWPEQAPFDVIIVTAAPTEVPEALLEQLKVGGRMVLPVGGSSQELVRITRTDTGFERESLIPVIFVPMKSGD